jgi:hypothetical protein
MIGTWMALIAQSIQINAVQITNEGLSVSNAMLLAVSSVTLFLGYWRVTLPPQSSVRTVICL